MIHTSRTRVAHTFTLEGEERFRRTKGGIDYLVDCIMIAVIDGKPRRCVDLSGRVITDVSVRRTQVFDYVEWESEPRVRAVLHEAGLLVGTPNH
jgi:hypothetical protein